VESVEGEQGNFQVQVHQEPRFIDISKCTACGDCEGVCPVDLPNEFDQGMSRRKATFKKFAQTVPGAYAIQKSESAPCRKTCPAGLNVQAYTQMVRHGRYERALEIIMDDLPLPGVLGRICTLIGEQDANISDLVFIDRKPDYYRLLIEVDLRDVEHMHRIMTALEAESHVSAISRHRDPARAGAVERQD